MTDARDEKPLTARNNPDLLGHGAAEARFLAAWNSGRLPHAWLITGSRGIGKATLAYRMARFVLAAGAEEGAGLFGAPAPATALHLDPEHPVFHRVAARGHSDLVTLERTDDPNTKRRRGVIVVDDVRAAGAFLALTPAEGSWRIVVVDCADELNVHAANALLKILEEPPHKSLLFLVCHAPGRLLPTIRSRCCRLALAALEDATVATLLARLRPELGPDDRAAVAALADGSAGRALALAEADGLALYRELVGLFAALPQRDVPAIHAFAGKLTRREAEPAWRATTELLGRAIARGAALAAGAVEQKDAVPGEGEVLARLARATGLDRWAEVWEKSTRLLRDADRVNLDRRQVLLNVFDLMADAARG